MNETNESVLEELIIFFFFGYDSDSVEGLVLDYTFVPFYIKQYLINS